MAQKRIASSELNHDNWDVEEEAETSGVFRIAPSSVLAGRQIKQATRRLKKSSDSTSEQGRAFPVFQALNFPSATVSSNNQTSFFTPLASPVSSNKNSLNGKEPANSAKTQKTESSVFKTEALPLITNSLSTVDSDKDGFGTSGTWALKSTRPFSAFAFGFPTASQTKCDSNGKSATDKSGSGNSSTNLSKWKPVTGTAKPCTDSNKPDYFITSPSATVLASPSPSAAKSSNDEAKLPPVTSNSSANDNNKLPSFTAKAFANYTSEKIGTSKPPTGDISNSTLITQPEQKVPEWSSPLKCCLDTRSISSTTSSALPASEILSKIDSRHLLKPVPEDIVKRLQSKCVASGKSLNFLKRTYQLNATTLDWLNLLVQENLTVNIAEVIPSYIQELLKLIDAEIASQKSERIGADLSPHQAILKQMLEVFHQVGLGGNEDGSVSASTVPTLPESNKIEKTVKVPSPTKELKLNAVNSMENQKAASKVGKLESDKKAESSSSIDKNDGEMEVKDKVSTEEEDNDDGPPKVVFTPVVEEGSVCTMRCKVFIKKTDPITYDTFYVDHGVGMLYIKPVARGKAQLVVRADNSLGKLLLNVCITAEIPIEVANPTTIMLVCRPQLGDTDPKTVLLRVKTAEDCELLHEKLIII